MDAPELERGIVVAIRRIIRAVDQHSRRLASTHGLTGPQLLLLQELYDAKPMATGELALRVHLAQGTVSEILDRLAERGMVSRIRSSRDRRRVEVRLTPEGRGLVERKPSLLQDGFAVELQKIAIWERHLVLSALERVAAMMNAQSLDAAPILASGPMESSAEETAEFLGD